MSGWVSKEIVDKIIDSYIIENGRNLLEDAQLFISAEPHLWNGIYSVYSELDKNEDWLKGAIFAFICVASFRLKEYQDYMLRGIKFDEEDKKENYSA